VEKLPQVNADFSTNVPGLYISGDLAGIPLLKFALDSGARAVRAIAADLKARAGEKRGGTDLAIVGGGVSGMAAAVEAQAQGLSFVVVESSEPLSTIVNFPKQKPIYTYPTTMKPEGRLQVSGSVKESLLEELREQVERFGITTFQGRVEAIERSGDGFRLKVGGGAPPIEARRVLLAIGRSGEFRRLNVPGESLDKVYNRLHDPKDYAGKQVLVVGGGDTAAETAVALAEAGAAVTLSYRKPELARPKPENVERLGALAAEPGAELRPGRIRMLLETTVAEILPAEVVLKGKSGDPLRLANDVVFTMIGREAPLSLLRASGVSIAGEMTTRRWAALAGFVAFCALVYNWKSGGALSDLFYRRHWFPTNLPELFAAAGGWLAAAAKAPGTLPGTLAISAAGPSFYYTLAYCTLVTVFGIRRIRRRRTPYVTVQTATLIFFQVVPLFLLPEIIFPLLHHNGLLHAGLADALFPACNYGHGREFWRAYGLILAWPLNVYNVFTHEPLWWWIGIGAVQTFGIIPLGIRYFGKGFYCGWICSCGALAETLGDTHRTKMPHGPRANRLNLAGQVILGVAAVMLVLRVVGWALPDGNWAERLHESVLLDRYKWTVDVFLGGVIGVGLYFWFSGRVWCRFFCPLAALMHVYARFSRFRIFADKKKCISCGVCTSVCHQGIDVMSFANKGIPMEDPECVRCSACVQQCPTNVLSFGRAGADGFVKLDTLIASSVKLREQEAAR
jgi:thioredoxin reductase/ferredoxin